MTRDKIVVETSASVFQALRSIAFGGNSSAMTTVFKVKKAAVSEKVFLLQRKKYISFKQADFDKRVKIFQLNYSGLSNGFFDFLHEEFEQYVANLKQNIVLLNFLKQDSSDKKSFVDLINSVGAAQDRLDNTVLFFDEFAQYKKVLSKSSVFQDLFKQIIESAIEEPNNYCLNDCFNEVFIAFARLEDYGAILDAKSKIKVYQMKKSNPELFYFFYLLWNLSDFRRAIAFPLKPDFKLKFKSLWDKKK